MKLEAQVDRGKRDLLDMGSAAKTCAPVERIDHYKKMLEECVPRLRETAQNGGWTSYDDRLLKAMLERGVPGAHEIRGIRLRLPQKKEWSELQSPTKPYGLLASESRRQRLERGA